MNGFTETGIAGKPRDPTHFPHPAARFPPATPPMLPSPALNAARRAALFLLLAACPATAQTVPANSGAAAADKAVQLSPFEVVSDATDTYEATNTSSLTGMSTSLNKSPLDARILNRTLMNELGGGDVFKLLSDFGGLGAMLFGGGTEDQRGMQDGDQAQPGGLSSRGFTISEPRRDGFLRSSTSMFNSFDVESAEAINGSNNLLYGSGEAGGVVVINSKRARVRQRAYRFTAMADSEGTRRYTMDVNAGAERFAFRFNALKSADRYWRPLLSLDQEGIQGAVTLRPYRWLNVFADYRHYQRAAVHSREATVRAPVNLLLTTGERLDNQASRYIIGVGGIELTNNFINFATDSSMHGPLARQHWVNESKSVTVDITPRADLAFQFRYAHDARINNGVSPSSTTVYHPDSPLNLWTDATGAPRRQWSIFSVPNNGPFWTGAHGYKFTAVGRRDLGRWGEHILNAFHSNQESWSNRQEYRFYEVDASGNTIQNLANITNGDSGRILMPAAWQPAFSGTMFGGISWPSTELVHPGNGKRYRLHPQVYAGAVPKTDANPMGLSGPINTTSTALPVGAPSSTIYTLDDTLEKSVGASLSSSFWKGRIDTMVGLRSETASTIRVTTLVSKGPLSYDSRTFGVVGDTPVRGVRAYASYSTNSKINFTTDRDVFNQILPIGRGNTREGGLKLSLWDHRLSGNVTYYVTEAENFTGTLGSVRNDVDPDGINGRNGGPGFVFNKISDGLSASLSARPLKPWQVTVSFTQANGSERSDVTLPVMYNDEFNTTSLNGQSVVAVKSSSGALTPLLVPSDPANPNSPTVPLSIAMMKTTGGPYAAQLDPDSGQILNAESLRLRTAGVGTLRTGLPISAHQLGFTPPVADIIVRKAGEPTTGYAEHSFSVINRFQVGEGRLRGLVLGLATVYQIGFRAYPYTDAADGGKRKIYYYPDRLENSAFVVFPFKPTRRTQASVQLNVTNLFDRQQVLKLLRNTNGTVRYFTYQYNPRNIALTANFSL